jgi:hypothetical protein
MQDVLFEVDVDRVSKVGLECFGVVLGSDLARFVVSMHEGGDLADDLELVVLLDIVRNILGTWLLDVSKLCVIDDSDNLRLDALGRVFPDLETKLLGEFSEATKGGW